MKKKPEPVRILTATAIFDGHDASINIIRRLLQDKGIEVIHLGHNRSVNEVVNAALQEDVDAICISSYQGGHLEYLKYLVAELKKQHAHDILIFAGGGGTIPEKDVDILHGYGVTKVYTATNSVIPGLQGIVDEINTLCLKSRENKKKPDQKLSDYYALAKKITEIQNCGNEGVVSEAVIKKSLKAKIIGVTGTGGSGKSTLIDEILKALLNNTKLKIACVAIDPGRQKTGGALLGDRICINSTAHQRLYFRSLSTRQPNTSITPVLHKILKCLDDHSFDLILIETAGIGQADNRICDYVDQAIYVMTADYGAPGQLEKISMLDYADIIVLNKADHRGSEDALVAVKKQWQNNHSDKQLAMCDVPVFSLSAHCFNDAGVNRLLVWLCKKMDIEFKKMLFRSIESSQQNQIIPSERCNYLSEIVYQAIQLSKYQQQQCEYADQLQHLYQALNLIGSNQYPDEFEIIKERETDRQSSSKELVIRYNQVLSKIDTENIQHLKSWNNMRESVHVEFNEYRIKDKVYRQNNYIKSLSHTDIPVIAPPDLSSWKDRLMFLLNENLSGSFPFTAGVYRYRNFQEDVARLFAGEGTPEDTNRRFFLLKEDQKSIRLSTAFDPLVLYAKDPQDKPDVSGCIGMSGVSVASLDDMKKLYSGINLCDNNTSVSMTINGPASVIMGFYLNTAIDQQIELYLKQQGKWQSTKKLISKQFKDIDQAAYKGDLPQGHDSLGLALLGVDTRRLIAPDLYEKISVESCKKIRGTLQADMLKEEQAQNECLYSLEFSFQLMADIQKYFIQHDIKQFYSVSISGYHIAEAGANPVTQLAFTLANGFTLLEYYLSQGLKIDDFCSQFSFFFSNGMDVEYAVIGRVARRIWARALKYVYGANERSQKLKYHIQTSGRSLQAQDIDLNDIRTSLQALYAINDNCNSLHTNAYDEAVTTPTDKSVRRALAIQLIINRELGLSVNQNPVQGSYLINELTVLVEQAVYDEFSRLSQRGGVIGAMEYFYQRNKIQEESMYAEKLKYSGDTPVIGVNQFVDKTPGSGAGGNIEAAKFIHSSDKQKQQQVDNTRMFKIRNEKKSPDQLKNMVKKIVKGGNSFAAIIEASRYCSLQQMSDALLDIGGEYRRKL